ncbi:hypothetical protein Nepgr_033731 [Nepenthes gracilis]|uniref:Uncharacterized protein n=1 Tax=Nepenthes gracilis TaxID=150966 RepID=A0AAD3Y6U7_NEPGR|nr:hypothetical protein Nepgr_033731 [Nepenthes gracilis]
MNAKCRPSRSHRNNISQTREKLAPGRATPKIASSIIGQHMISNSQPASALDNLATAFKHHQGQQMTSSGGSQQTTSTFTMPHSSCSIDHLDHCRK